MLGKYRWLLIFFAALVTAGGGLYLGKLKEKDYLGRMYERRDFTLLDDGGNFFQLSKFPKNKLLLLVFLPDGLPPSLVKDFRAFSRNLVELRNLDVETLLISRSNKEVARNFKEASGFKRPLLWDPSGTVGRLVGIWPSPLPVSHWGYALLDNRFQVYWVRVSKQPLPYPKLLAELKTLSASIQTSSGSR
jgi:peroxiredoxin